MSEQARYRDPVRNVNREFIHDLEVISNKEMPLPGARCRGGEKDPRFTHLSAGTGEAILFDHLATVRHKRTGMIFVVFKKTMDALHLEQTDISKYPSWLMDSTVKKSELDVYIHTLKAPYDKNPGLVTRDRTIIDPTAQTRIHKWLTEITTPWVFDSVAYFLLSNKIITQEMYGKI